MEAAKMRIAIVDDEQSMRELFQSFLTRYAEENHVAFDVKQFSTGDLLLENYRPVYDILIFDIDMPGRNGLDTAREIRKTDDQSVILFVTNIAQYAINGYEVNAIDYMIKPIGYYDFSMKFKKAVKIAQRNRRQNIVIDTLNGPASLLSFDIVYVEVMAHYLIYHTVDQEYRVRSSLKDHELFLKDYFFTRCHKSYLINLQRLTEIRASDVLVAGMSIPLGRAYKDSMLVDYMHYLHR